MNYANVHSPFHSTEHILMQYLRNNNHACTEHQAEDKRILLKKHQNTTKTYTKNTGKKKDLR